MTISHIFDPLFMQNLRTLQVQDDRMQNSWENGEAGELDLHEYSSKLTEGENIGKFQCNVCGKISNWQIQAWMHVESVHFPGSYEYECDHNQCGEKFDTKSKWDKHRSRVHSSMKSK